MFSDEAPYEHILDSLKEIQKNLENDQSLIDWRFVRFHLGSLKRLKQFSDFFYDVYQYILHLFSVYRCRDFSVIADTFQLESFIFEYSSDSLKKATRMTYMMKENQTCCQKEGLNYVAKLMEMPYKSLNLPFDLMYDVIHMHVSSIEDKILKFLLEYGVMYVPLSDHTTTWAWIRKQISILVPRSQKKFVLNLQTIQANFNQLSPESRQRMLAVFRGVEVILKAKCKHPLDFALCFRMAYETIPEPIITSNEVENFLKYALSGSSVNTIIEEIRKYYEKLFPESCEPRAPRTLKHLSRCQVRQNLRQARSFPWGVLEIELPASVKDYIISVENDYMHEQYHK